MQTVVVHAGDSTYVAGEVVDLLKLLEVTEFVAGMGGNVPIVQLYPKGRAERKVRVEELENEHI